MIGTCSTISRSTPWKTAESVFFGIVRQHADLGKPQVFENLSADHVVALVGLEAEAMIGLDRVEPLVLQLVGLELRQQADPATFLRQVDDRADSLLIDHLHGDLKLIATIAAKRSEDVAREARRVHPDEWRPLGVRRSPHTRASGSWSS